MVAVYRHESSTAEHAANMLESLSLAADNRAGVRDVLRNFLAECLGAPAAQAAAKPGGRLPGLMGIALNRVLDGEQPEAALAAAAAVVRRVPRREDSYRRLMSQLAKLAIAWCEAQPPHVRTAPVRVDALTDLAAAATLDADASAATALAAEALAVARSLGPDQSRRLARAWYNVGTGQANSGDLAAAREALAAAAALARDGGGTDAGGLIERCETLVNLGSCLADLDDQAAALDVCVEAIELAPAVSAAYTYSSRRQVPSLGHLRGHEFGDGAGHRGRIVDRDPCLGAGNGDQRGTGEVGGEPPGVVRREEAALLAPDQQDRPAEARDLPGGVEEELRAEAGHGGDEVARHPPVPQRRAEQRLGAPGVYPGRGEAGQSPAPGGRRPGPQPELQPH